MYVQVTTVPAAKTADIPSLAKAACDSSSSDATTLPSDTPLWLSAICSNQSPAFSHHCMVMLTIMSNVTLCCEHCECRLVKHLLTHANTCPLVGVAVDCHLTRLV
ncbi:hypothetical protein EB796_004517 [Bugula neritina]|uniref:Uncharacterized protein n=1 Tax=Bugula neritina TaxID=10212 RepID=A0A7J7KI89_BUGNE|nr:hypothetical protein EB796_004517 [Bugula neritina]